MFNQRQNTKTEMPYATGTDFCRIFAHDMDRLYLLALLLTGSESKAEKVFVSGLEDSTKRNTVFREWARSWARRKIIQNAIEMIRPQATATAKVEDRRLARAGSEPPELAAIIALSAFERFVFVMAVLEGYPIHDCSILLSSTRSEVVEARSRALQQIGNSAKLRQNSLLASLDHQSLKPDREPTLEVESIPHFAISA